MGDDPGPLWIGCALAAGIVPAAVCVRWHRRAGPAPVPAPELAADLGLLGVLGLAASMVARGAVPAAIRAAGGSDSRAEAGGYAGLLVVAAALLLVARRAPGVQAFLASGSVRGSSSVLGPGSVRGSSSVRGPGSVRGSASVRGAPAVRGCRGLGLGALAYLAVVGPVLAAHWFNRTHVVPEDGNRIQKGLRLILDPDERAAGIVLAASVATVVPLFEELVYRGFLQSAFRSALDRVLGPRGAAALAIAAASVVFTVVHDRSTWLPIFVLGLALGVLWERTRSLWVCGGFHATHNLLTVVWAYAAAPA